MKIFAVSLLLLISMVALVVINALYIERTIDRMIELSDASRNNKSAESLDELCRYWESHRSFIALSVSLREIDSVTENLLNIKSAFSEGNEWMLEQSYALFLNALEDIRRYEKIALINIF